LFFFGCQKKKQGNPHIKGGLTKKNEGEGLREDMNQTPVHEPPPLNEEFAHLMQYLDT
jgi:hypothetical protein